MTFSLLYTDDDSSSSRNVYLTDKSYHVYVNRFIPRRRPRFGTHPEPLVGCSPTVHPEANGDLVETLGEIKAARKGTGHPTSQSRWPRTSVLSNRHSPNVRVVYRTYLTAIPYLCKQIYIDQLVTCMVVNLLL